MRLALPNLKGFLAESRFQGRAGLLYQRLFWGAIAGCVAAILLGESPFLESLELTMLKWRYKVSNQLSSMRHQPQLSNDVTVVAFDDSSQFDLGIARFNDQRSQSILSEAINVIEKGDPALVAVDLDLRGAAHPGLIKSLQRHRNVVLALFGSLEGSTDLPAAEFMTHAASYGYAELARESNGVVYRLPINDQSVGGDDSAFAPVSSLTEAIIDVHRRVKGVGPSRDFLPSHPDQPVYVNFRHIHYPVVSFQQVLSPNFDPAQFKNRIVLIGSTLTSRKDDPLRVRTPLDESLPEVEAQAQAVSTLLDGQAIFSFAREIARYLLIVFGAVFGAACSAFPAGLRSALLFATTFTMLVMAQVCFQFLHVAVPVVPTLAVLVTSFVLGTVIFLDTDLRQSNRELAAARLDMQERAEKERQRIAEDLHDETLPALSAVARMADKLSTEMGDNPVPGQMREKLDNAVTEMRRVINDLHPSVLETMGFVPALENLLHLHKHDSGMDCEFADSVNGSDCSLPMFTQLQLYRIVQEALNNVQKHSHADKAEVKISNKDGFLTIAVADNGQGFDPSKAKKDSHGLVNIRQRAQLIGAEVEWRKPKIFPSGTEIRIRIATDRQQKGSRNDDINS
jgi:signal transduction histidine kinase